LRSTSAEICGGASFLSRTSPRRRRCRLDDLEGHQVDVLLHFLLFELAADQALDRVQGVLRVGDGLALGRGADQDFAVFL
jgi:hypothetical protein